MYLSDYVNREIAHKNSQVGGGGSESNYVFVRFCRDIYNDERILGELLEQTEHERDQLVGDYIQSEKVQKQLVHDALVQQDAKRNQLIQQVRFYYLV